MRVFALLIPILFLPAGAQAQGATCPRDAWVASRAVWPVGGLRPGRTEVGTHPCGRKIQCTGGRRSERGSRNCRWL